MVREIRKAFRLPEYELEFITKLLFRHKVCDLTFVKTQDYVSFLVYTRLVLEIELPR